MGGAGGLAWTGALFAGWGRATARHRHKAGRRWNRRRELGLTPDGKAGRDAHIGKFHRKGKECLDGVSVAHDMTGLGSARSVR